MATEIYISIINLNDNRLNAPNKRHRLTGRKQNKNCTCAMYKRPTSDRGTQSEQMEKRYSMQIEIKRKRK